MLLFVSLIMLTFGYIYNSYNWIIIFYHFLFENSNTKKENAASCYYHVDYYSDDLLLTTDIHNDIDDDVVDRTPPLHFHENNFTQINYDNSKVVDDVKDYLKDDFILICDCCCIIIIVDLAVS